MMHRRDDFGAWMVRGFAIALAFMLFQFFTLAVILVAALFWNASGKWSTGWRRFTRGVFVGLGIIVILGVLAAIFSD